MSLHNEIVSNQETLNGHQPVESIPGLFRKFCDELASGLKFAGKTNAAILTGVTLGKVALFGSAAVATGPALVGLAAGAAIVAAFWGLGKGLEKHLENSDLKKEN